MRFFLNSDSKTLEFLFTKIVFLFPPPPPPPPPFFLSPPFITKVVFDTSTFKGTPLHKDKSYFGEGGRWEREGGKGESPNYYSVSLLCLQTKI